MKSAYFSALLMLTLFMIGCSSAPKQPPEQSGFLENYDLLQAIPSPEGTEFFSYKNPTIDPNDYHAAIIEPVYVYQDFGSESEVTRENIEKARMGINRGLKHIIENKYQLTQHPGPDVMRVRVAITGASIEREGFKPWNIIPVSAAIRLATKASDLDNKTAVLVVELKFTDSQTGELIKETVTVISGENFRQHDDISDEFEQLAQTWAQEAMPVL